MNWRLILPNLVSLAAMAAGFSSILMELDERHLAAAQLIMLAMILDGLDGNLARLLNGTSKFGAELDTYVDMTAFGLAPAVLVYKKIVLFGQGMLDLLLPLMIVILGVIRLARFKTQDNFRGQKGYTGLPITVSAGWIALFTLIGHHVPGRFPSNNFTVVFFGISLLICLILQISNVRYPKPTKNLVNFGICIVLILPLFLPNSPMTVPAAVILFALGFFYVLLGPFWGSAPAGGKRTLMPSERP